MIEISQNIIKKIKKIPTDPGVYFFVDKNKKILYIGKATSLRNRIRSYFTKDIAEKRSTLIAKMVEEVVDIKITKTNSVLEALILEAALIKKHQPDYNTDEKDQKSWNYIVITEEEFPKVVLMRQRELQSKNDKFRATFGPFPHGSELRTALKIVRKIFPYRDRCKPNTRGCLNYELGLCPGVCAGAISQKDYNKTIKYIVKFFQGKTSKLIIDLKKEMQLLAKNYNFEEANLIKRKIFALEHVNDVALLGKGNDLLINDGDQILRIEAYDIAHTSGKNIVGVMTVIENGEIKKSDYRMFKVREQKDADDTRALSEILHRRFKHTEWPLPKVLVVDGAIAQLNVAKVVLEAAAETKDIALVAVTKDERHRPKEIQYLNKAGESAANKFKREILLSNSEAHRFGLKFHRKQRDRW